MTILDGQRVIAIEEHYSDPEVTSLFEGIDGNHDGVLTKTELMEGMQVCCQPKVKI